MNRKKYKAFKESAANELLVQQEQLKNLYRIDSYENWYYEQAIALLTFSTGDKQLNFRYVDIGSYSRNTNTWMWSWNNEHTLDTVKLETNEVKEFGIQNEIEELTTGTLDCDESHAWDLCAVAVKLLGAMGAYRPVSDHLLIFMALIEVVPNDEAERLKDTIISCDRHGTGRVTFVCQHLSTLAKTGFEESFETHFGMELDDDQSLQAWCDLCEAERLREGKWTDASIEFANIKLVCESCYFEMKENNLGCK